MSVGHREQLTADAERAAKTAAARAGVSVKDVVDLGEETAISGLFDRVWGGHNQVPANLLRALSHAGGYLAAAYRDTAMVGAGLGFLGRSQNEVYLHSHMTGVDPNLQRAGVGFAVKVHQRAWALSNGLERVQWTFDPLVRHNAYFNLVKLGAEVVDYHVNFYGDMLDGINAGDESDRVLVSWDLASDRATNAGNGVPQEPDLDEFRSAGAAVALDFDDTGRPRPGAVSGNCLLCHIPEDIVDLRHRDPGAAREWRHALRDTFGEALQNGYRATAITRSGWYLLEREPAG